MPEYTNLNDVIVDGRVESSAQGRIMGSFAVMPAASILNENCIILYSGTTGTYVSGQFYMCVESGGSYSWQPVTISGTEEDTYTANRALATNAQGKVVASGVTDTELGYLSGLGGSVTSLLNGKVDKVSGSRLMTDAEGTKLAGIAAGAQVNVIEAVQNNGVAVPISGKTVNITHPTKLSEFTNDTQFITSTVSNLQNYYDKTNVDALISAIPKFSIQVSQSGLPASGNSTTIYLVPKTAGSQDAYDEYLYVNNQWEKIGSTQVNFSFDQSGTDILINGTAIRSATTSQSGVMTAAQVGSLNTAVSGVSNLQSQYGSLNSTVSDISGRLGTVESTLSTTVSQISTLQTGLNGKADAGTEITGGAFSNNTLSLMKAGGGSVDINFPEQNPTLKYYTLKSIADSMIIATSSVITEYGETVRADYIGDTLISAHEQGVFGIYGLYGVYVDGTETIQVSSTTTQSNKEILNDFIVNLPDSFQVDIEDGKYKMPIDTIYTSSIYKTAIRLASAHNTISDTEWIYFTVHNTTATITNNPKLATLNKNHFCGEISTGTRIDIFWDRIIKIG